MRCFEVPRALVTGGAGFLGSFLCERPLAAGCHVICVDSFCTIRRDEGRTYRRRAKYWIGGRPCRYLQSA